MTKEEIIKSALKFLVQKQTEQGSWGFSDDNDYEVSWNEVIEWLEQEPCEDAISREDAIRLAEQGQIQGYEWQFKKLCNLPSVISQTDVLDKIRAELIQSIQNGTLKIESGNEELFRIIDKYIERSDKE